jgi:hypothetical protein
MKLNREPIKRVEIKIIEFNGQEYVGSKGFSVYDVSAEEVKKLIIEAVVEKVEAAS